MLKILQVSFNSTWTKNFQMFKLDLKKAKETEIKFPISIGSSKMWEFQKSIYFCFIDYSKAVDSVYHNKLENSYRDGEYQTTWPASWEICMQVKKQQLELDMEQQTGSKSGKEYIKALYCHPAYLTYMQSTLWEMLDWKKHKLESRLPEEISITPDTQMIPTLMAESKEN